MYFFLSDDSLTTLLTQGLTKNGFDNVKEPEMCLLFSSVDTGSIIGKRGATITNFRAMSGAFIKAFPNKLQNCDERVLLIRGDVDKIIKCISCIFSEYGTGVETTCC